MNDPERQIIADGTCLRHSRDWARAPGDYLCDQVVTVVPAEGNIIEQRACPLGLRVLESRDEVMSRHYSERSGWDVVVRETTILAADYIDSLTGCIYPAPTSPPTLNINT